MIERIRSIVSALAMAAIVFCATSLDAQTIDSPYRFVETSQGLGVYGGNLFTGQGTLNLGPESAPGFGVRYALRVTGPFNVEGALMYSPSTRMVYDTVPSDTVLRVVGEADITVLAATASLRFDVTGPRTWNALQPFVVLGAGLALDLASDAEAEADLPEDAKFDYGTRFLGVAGGGLEVHLSPRITINADARTMLWKLNTPDAFLSGAAVLVRPPDEWTQNFLLSAGVSFRF